jgi:hypothetical protein
MTTRLGPHLNDRSSPTAPQGGINRHVNAAVTGDSAYIAYGLDHPDVAKGLEDLSDTYRALNRSADAERAKAGAEAIRAARAPSHAPSGT